MSVARLELFVKAHMAAYDPSHDWVHGMPPPPAHLTAVERVRRTALKLAPPEADILVVELAALMHDLSDAKYASTNLAHIAADHLGDVSAEQVALVLRIVPAVSYSKEMRLRAAGEWTWQDTCVELHAVQDADRLDAIGAVGVLRCAAFSGVRGRVLLDAPGGDSAEAHFHDKLLRVKSYMKVRLARWESAHAD